MKTTLKSLQTSPSRSSLSYYLSLILLQAGPFYILFKALVEAVVVTFELDFAYLSSTFITEKVILSICE